MGIQWMKTNADWHVSVERLLVRCGAVRCSVYANNSPERTCWKIGVHKLLTAQLNTLANTSTRSHICNTCESYGHAHCIVPGTGTLSLELAIEKQGLTRIMNAIWNNNYKKKTYHFKWHVKLTAKCFFKSFHNTSDAKSSSSSSSSKRRRNVLKR